ncbi:hypothetical protein Hanom_Chr08g00694671 [Helianthus anomalus]
MISNGYKDLFFVGFFAYLSAPLHSKSSFPVSSLTITDILFRALLNSKTFKSSYVLQTNDKKD